MPHFTQRLKTLLGLSAYAAMFAITVMTGDHLAAFIAKGRTTKGAF